MHAMWLRLQALWKRRKLDSDLADEMAFHVAMRRDKYIAAGASSGEAAARARRDFGSSLQARESLRELWTFRWIETLGQDLRFAARSFARNPVFTLTAVLSLALGIGAVSAIYDMAYTMLLRPMPVDEPERLMALYQTSPQRSDDTRNFSYPELLDYAGQETGLTDFAGSQGVPLRVTGAQQPELIWGQIVTGNFISGLRLRMAAGRGFLPEEDRATGERPVAILCYPYWQRRFQGDPGVIGRTIEINGHALTIVGVTAWGFAGTQMFNYVPDVLVPLRMQPILVPSDGNWIEDRANRWAIVRARLKPGVSRRQAEAALQVVADRLARTYPDTNRGLTVHMIAGGTRTHAWLVSTGAIAAITTVLTGAVILLLLIACSNVGNLMLARAASRSREMATRLAIGAGRGRLVRQLLTEALLLALAGGAAGLILARISGAGLWSFYPTLDFQTTDLESTRTLDPSVYLFTLAVTAGTVFLFGLAPALRASRIDQASAIRGAEAGFRIGGRRIGAAPLLVLAQVALSSVLLIAGGLFLRSMLYAGSTDPGFDRAGLLVFTVDLDLQGYAPDRGRVFQRELIRRLEAQPGVEAAAIAAPMPLGPEDESFLLSVPGYAPQPNESMGAGRTMAGPGYFRTVGTRLVAGRAFTQNDDESSPRVAVINETFARRFWGAPDSALGRQFQSNRNEKLIEVIGVARDGKYTTFGETPVPYAFFSIEQVYRGRVNVAVRTRRPLEDMLTAVRREVGGLDPTLPVLGMKTIPQYLERLLSIYQSGAALLGAFAGSALLLSGVGLFGLLHFSVTQRTREIGIRMALGALRGEVAWSVVRRALILVGIGLAAGVVCAGALRGLLGKLIAGVDGADPVTYLTVIALVIALGLVAALLPARRAASIDPVRALHWE